MTTSLGATAWTTNADINLFREYLRIPSVHPNVNYTQCIVFLMAQAQALGLDFRVINVDDNPDKPVAIFTWPGTDPTLPSISLNSHMDVVPVDESMWTHPPFGAEIDEDGNIFARGTQDMKSVGIQYLAAIKRLRAENRRNKRTVHVLFTPDEEIGGLKGMARFVLSDAFRALNVGLALDEGGPSMNDAYTVFYAERSIWYVEFCMNGTPGHGSLLYPNTAGEKLAYILRKMYEYREGEIQKMAQNSNVQLGDVTTINLTGVKGGIQDNVIPPKFCTTFDIRIEINQNHEEFEAMLNRWCTEAGGDIVIKYNFKAPRVEPTKMDESNIFFGAFKSALNDDLGLEFLAEVCPGGTDSRYIRALGIPVFGFSPMARTPPLLHGNNECLSAETFLKGIDIYEKLIPRLANVQQVTASRLTLRRRIQKLKRPSE